MKPNILIYILTAFAIFLLTIAILIGVENSRLRSQNQSVPMPPMAPADMPSVPFEPLPPLPPQVRPDEPKDKLAVDEALLPNSVLTLLEEVTIVPGSPCGWLISADKTFACGLYIQPSSQPRVIQKGTQLIVRSVRRERTLLPGKVWSMDGVNGVIQTNTSGGVEVYIVTVSGVDLKLVGSGGQTQYIGAGNVPKLASVKLAFDISMAGPQIIRNYDE